MSNEDKKYPVLKSELQRLESLYQYDILGMPPEDQFDDLTRLTARILDLPICQITLMDENWQDFISNYGVDMDGNDRENSFCQYTVVQQNIMEVQDTLEDPRFNEHPLVLNSPHLRYYIGAPLLDNNGLAIGTLCGYGVESKKMTDFQIQSLQEIAKTVMRIIRYRKVNKDQKKYVNIFNLNQDLLCVISKDGFLKLINPAFSNLLGWSEKELLSSPVIKFVHPDDIIKLTEESTKAKFNDIKNSFNCRLISKNGKEIGVDWSYFMDENSSVVVASGHDMSKLLDANNSLEEAVKVANKAVMVKDEFLSNMSHEIRTPLSSIVGFTDLLKKSNLDKEQKLHIDTVGIASNHLMNIINDILDVYKLSDGKIVLENEPIELEKIGKKIEVLYKNSAAIKNLDFKVEIDQSLPKYVLGDETRLIQILSNLVGNAIKFTERGEVIVLLEEVVTADNKVKVLFSVKDSGIGINSDQKHKVFERFTQATETTSKLYGGTGLGLNITKLLLNLHKSQINLITKEHGGTHFYFEIDFEIIKIEENIKEEEEEFQHKSIENLTILLVEDNEHLQLLCKSYLKKHKINVTSAFDGNEAIEFIKSNEYDLVIMDIQMPNLDGLGATKIIREELGLKVPILGCSANSNPEEMEKCLKTGMSDFISKPYSIEDLIKKIHENTQEVNVDNFELILKELRVKEGDELVDQFQDIFRNRVPNDLKELKEAYDVKDLNKIYQKSHFLSTTFCTLGFVKGEQLALNINNAYKKQDQETTIIFAKKLITYLEEALVKV